MENVTPHGLSFLDHGGEMGREIRVHDWSSSPLGPLAAWPQSLRTAVGMLVNNQEPRALIWGADLITIHNDSYLRFVRPPLPHGIGAAYPQVSPDLWPALSALVEEARGGRGTFIPDLPVRREGSGETGHFIFCSSPVFDEDDSVAGVQITLVETTTAVESQREIARDRDRLRELLEQSPGFAALLTGPKHEIVFVNEAMRQLLGNRELVGRAAADAIPELEGEGLVAALDDARRTGVAHSERDRRVMLGSGPGSPANERVMDFVYQPVRTADGTVRSIFVIGFDRTEKARAQERVALLQNELIHLSRVSAMGTMASVLAHEVNQPIIAAANFVRGARHALDRRNDVLARSGLVQADESLMRAGATIARIRATVSQSEMRRQESDVATLVRDACSLALIGGADADIAFEFDLPDGLTVLVDRTQIEQVILNIVRNASEAMAGAAERRLRIAAARAGKMIETRFCDSGPGIDPAVLDRLFVPFVTSKSEGMGIGLPVSRTIIEAHGGQLTADNAPGGGAVLRFTLPAAR
ncbi:PAS domain-containing sensor histidine kinase [Sphingosinicella sp. YJ22]|uniref:two-component system sensor histidine kinase NtrB n=1 Tax=Sphingosinicella sp. YJ22 TaxID=1104780 RepID=UPI00140D29DA|nr:PAS domain-containing sensor histidine kinase [Sphingosinicella sp. YJ22]